MTQDSLKKQISLLKKEGINRVLYDAIYMYLTDDALRVSTDLPGVVPKINELLSARYKEQLPKKVVRVKQKDLLEEIKDWNTDQFISEPGDVLDHKDPFFERWKKLKQQKDGGK